MMSNTAEQEVFRREEERLVADIEKGMEQAGIQFVGKYLEYLGLKNELLGITPPESSRIREYRAYVKETFDKMLDYIFQPFGETVEYLVGGKIVGEFRYGFPEDVKEDSWASRVPQQSLTEAQRAMVEPAKAQLEELAVLTFGFCEKAISLSIAVQDAVFPGHGLTGSELDAHVARRLMSTMAQCLGLSLQVNIIPQEPSSGN